MPLSEDGVVLNDLLAHHTLEPDDPEKDLATLVGLPPMPSLAVRRCRNVIVLSLLLSNSLGYTGVRYSRDNNRYGQKNFGHPAWFTARNMRQAADSLTPAFHALLHQRTKPTNPTLNGAVIQQSRFEALGEFPELCAQLKVFLPQTPPQRIVLRDKNGFSVALPEHPLVDQTKSFLEQYDPAVRAADLSVQHERVRYQGDERVSVCGKDGLWRPLSFKMRYLTRIFSRGMGLGGRFYQVPWCMIGGDIRKTMRIDREPVAEHDFSACHLRIAHFACGAELPETTNGQLYDLSGEHEFERRNIKIAVQIMLNARSRTGAVGAIAANLQERRSDASFKELREKASELYDRIEEKYSHLEGLWGTGVGLVFQFIDSEIIRKVLIGLLDQHGALGLSVHDSVIVQAKYFPELVPLMERTFDECGQSMAPQCVEDFLSELRSKPSGRAQQYQTQYKGKRLSRADQIDLSRWSAGKLPKIVNLSKIEPWARIGVSRATWYTQTPDQIDRQVDGLRVALMDGEGLYLTDTTARLARVKQIRHHAGFLKRLPADELVEQLEDVIAGFRGD